MNSCLWRRKTFVYKLFLSLNISDCSLFFYLKTLHSPKRHVFMKLLVEKRAFYFPKRALKIQLVKISPVCRMTLIWEAKWLHFTLSKISSKLTKQTSEIHFWMLFCFFSLNKLLFVLFQDKNKNAILICWVLTHFSSIFSSSTPWKG